MNSGGRSLVGQPGDRYRMPVTVVTAALAGFGAYAILRPLIEGSLGPAAMRALAIALPAVGALLGVGVVNLRAASASARRADAASSVHDPDDGDPSLRALLDSAVDAIITIDELGIIESVNQATERLFGWREEELLGRNVKILMPSPFRQEHDGYLANYRETSDRKIIGIGREVMAARKDGSTFPIDLAVNEVIEGGRRRFMGVIRDIADRKRAEEATRRERDFAENLLDTAPVIVLALDPHGTIVRLNRFLEETSGRDREALVGGDWVEMLLPAEARSEMRERLARGHDGDCSVASFGRVPLVTADGGAREIEWTAAKLNDAEGSFGGCLLVGVDVTERIRLEERFRQVQKMDAVGRLAGGIAHDFNTLLGSITGYSEMLLERLGEDAAKRRPAEQIYRCANRGAALTRQLLSFSRQHVLQPKELDLGGLLLDMEDMLDRLSGDDVEVRIEIDEETGQIWADASQIEQVIMNLVVNALDAMPRGGCVQITTDRLDIDGECPDCGSELAAGSYARVVVRDNGLGMGAEVRQRLFEPFFTTKEQGRGTGLGLATVYGIVKKSKGCIGVESAPNAGTTFRICLPSAGAVVAEARHPVAADRASRTERKADNRGDESILLVEDDSMFLSLLEEILGGQGYRVDVFASPRAALAAVEEAGHRYDMLISDIVMPEMNGTELARALACHLPTLRVLLMSGYTDEDLEFRGARDEHLAYIHKPFTTEDFLSLVRRVLDAEPSRLDTGTPAPADSPDG